MKWRVSAALALGVAACAGPQHGQPKAPPPARGGPVADLPVKIGRPYQVAGIWYAPADDRTYDEVGLASWYGPGFHGGATANGERFDKDMVGAAHKTLPLPSYVEVTALDTGRRIVVRINDRGPFVAGRIIDLSQRAAELLGTARAGVARVRVRRVYPDDATRLALRSGKAAAELPYVPVSELAVLRARIGRTPPSPGVAPDTPGIADILARARAGGYQDSPGTIAPASPAEEVQPPQ